MSYNILKEILVNCNTSIYTKQLVFFLTFNTYYDLWTTEEETISLPWASMNLYINNDDIPKFEEDVRKLGLIIEKTDKVINIYYQNK